MPLMNYTSMMFMSCFVVHVCNICKIKREIKRMKQHGPELQYVVDLEKKNKGGPKVKCCVCDKTFVGTWWR